MNWKSFSENLLGFRVGLRTSRPLYLLEFSVESSTLLDKTFIFIFMQYIFLFLIESHRIVVIRGVY